MKRICFIVGGDENSTVYKSTQLITSLMSDDFDIDIVFRKSKYLYVYRKCSSAEDLVLYRLSIISFVNNLLNFFARLIFFRSLFTIDFISNLTCMNKFFYKNFSTYDYIGFQWIGGGAEIMVPYLAELPNTKIVVFHRDWWWLTAGCHVPSNENCADYTKCCDRCLQKNSAIANSQRQNYQKSNIGYTKRT